MGRYYRRGSGLKSGLHAAKLGLDGLGLKGGMLGGLKPKPACDKPRPAAGCWAGLTAIRWLLVRSNGVGLALILSKHYQCSTLVHCTNLLWHSYQLHKPVQVLDQAWATANQLSQCTCGCSYWHAQAPLL